MLTLLARALIIGCSIAIPAVRTASSADALAGDAAFMKYCDMCHYRPEMDKTKFGPSLHGIIGRKFGSVAGFPYSKAMIEDGKRGYIWREFNLSIYLMSPKNHSATNGMTFTGFSNIKGTTGDEAEDIAAYLGLRQKDGLPGP